MSYGFLNDSLNKLYAVVALMGVMMSSMAGDISPAMQNKIDAYKQKLVEYASDPDIIKATRDANSKGPIAGMDNNKWSTIAESDPVSKGFVENSAGKKLTQWMNLDSKGINKMVLSDKGGNRFAYTSKPATYLSKGKAHFDESFVGKVWHQPEVKPDPSTKIETVQITAPVKDGEQVIGVLLMSLTADNLK